MGKDLRNKELGMGLSQRKDGSYTARFVTQTGYRKQSYFRTLQEARDWLRDAKYEDQHNTVLAPFEYVANDILNNDASLVNLADMTADEWFSFWIKKIVPDLRSNTIRILYLLVQELECPTKTALTIRIFTSFGKKQESSPFPCTC